MFAHVNCSDGLTLAVTFAIAISLAPHGAGAQSFMSEEEMLATLPGAQVSGKSRDGTPWAQAYGKRSGNKTNGIFNGVFGTEKYKGKWAVRNGEWCEDTGDWQGCFRFVRTGDKTLAAYRDGKQQNDWQIK